MKKNKKKKNHRHKERWSKKEILNIIALADKRFINSLHKITNQNEIKPR